MDKTEKQKNDPNLTPNEVAQLLKCSLKTVYNYTVKGILKRHSWGGRRVYYLRLEVEEARFKID